jgi:hypothetical protein
MLNCECVSRKGLDEFWSVKAKDMLWKRISKLTAPTNATRRLGKSARAA